MKLHIFIFFILALLFAACKKDTHNNNQTGQIVFTLNGQTRTFTVQPTDTLYTYDTLGTQQKELYISGFNGQAGCFLDIFQTVPLPGGTGFNLQPYPSYDTLCLGLNGYTRCTAYYLDYVDPVLGALTSLYTDTAVLNVTSFSTSPNLISGNFSCHVTDTYGDYYVITNGTFTNVPFVIAP